MNKEELFEKMSDFELSITKQLFSMVKSEEDKIVFDYFIDKLQENKEQKQALLDIKDKLLCYGETFDNKIHQEMQKELLDIVNKAIGGVNIKVQQYYKN